VSDKADRRTVAFEQAESRYWILRAQCDAGELDEEAFRVEVAKLLLQGDADAVWMLDADSGTWYCSRGEGWEPGDPYTQPLPEPAEGAERKAGRGRAGRLLALAVVLLLLLGVAGAVALQQGLLDVAWNPFRPASTQDVQVQVLIASPADEGQVPLGQVIAVESSIEAEPDLQAVDRVALQVNGQTVDVQSVRANVQPGQTSYPLSQPWLPDAAGEYEIVVTALANGNEPLATASISLQVVDVSAEAQPPDPPCLPGATFVADVTIPPGAAFPPGAQMDKVWQVRNSGSCAWGGGYELIPLEGELLNAPEAVPVPPTAVGELADLAVTLWAPQAPGTYDSVWQLRSPDGAPFGPKLLLTIRVRFLAEEGAPPAAPAGLQAVVTEDGAAVRLTWSDQSENEDAFRIYRGDLEASIGLTAADAEQYVDAEISCGNTYRYTVKAFNAAGTSAASDAVEVTLPPCAPADAPPALSLTVVPTQVQASETFTVAFQAEDDLGLELVVVWGVETGDAALDSGRVFTCTQVVCTGTWPLTWQGGTSATLTLVAVALDSSGQRSEPAATLVPILPPERLTAEPTRSLVP
jgi:hypothetical protein